MKSQLVEMHQNPSINAFSSFFAAVSSCVWHKVANKVANKASSIIILKGSFVSTVEVI